MATFVPPALDRRGSELGCVATRSDSHSGLVAINVVVTIRNRIAKFLIREVVRARLHWG